jgi:MFS family permease
VCTGLGTSFISVPSIAAVPPYFRRRRARAMSLATVGSGLGSTLYPLMFQSLQARVGFPWALRAMGLVALVLCVFALCVVRPVRHGGRPSVKWSLDTAAFSERTYVLYCVAIFFNNLVFFNSPYYLQSYAVRNGMAGSALAQHLVALLNACTIPGRILPSFFADRYGALDTYIVVCACASVSVFCWVGAVSAAGNIAFAVVYGFFSGGVVALATVVITSITPDLGRLGTRLGMVNIIKGVASLVGPPISGAILGSTGKYLGIQLFAALGLMLTTLFSVALRMVLVREESTLPAEGLMGACDDHGAVRRNSASCNVCLASRNDHERAGT